MSVFICENRKNSLMVRVGNSVDIFNAEKICYGHMQLFTQTPFSCEKRFVSEVVSEDSCFHSPVSTY